MQTRVFQEEIWLLLVALASSAFSFLIDDPFDRLQSYDQPTSDRSYRWIDRFHQRQSRASPFDAPTARGSKLPEQQAATNVGSPDSSVRPLSQSSGINEA